MTILYTMTVRMKKISRDVDPITGEIIETVSYREHKMTGLPSQTVSNWRKDFPDSIVSVEQEEARPSYRSREPRPAPRSYSEPRTQSRPPRATSAGSSPSPTSLGYADAINARIEKDARNAA